MLQLTFGERRMTFPENYIGHFIIFKYNVVIVHFSNVISLQHDRIIRGNHLDKNN